MAITIDLPPQMVQEASGYAQLEGTSLEKVCLDYIARELQRRREAERVMESFRALAQSTSKRRTAPYVFNRADAYEEVSA